MFSVVSVQVVGVSVQVVGVSVQVVGVSVQVVGVSVQVVGVTNTNTNNLLVFRLLVLTLGCWC